MNSVQLNGRLCSDLQKGNKCWLVTIALRPAKKEGQADFIPILFPEKLGETVSKYFHKGDGIIITGRLSSYKKGERDSRVSVVALDFYFPIGLKYVEQDGFNHEINDDTLPY